jgi:hypothetical protein
MGESRAFDAWAATPQRCAVRIADEAPKNALREFGSLLNDVTRRSAAG